MNDIEGFLDGLRDGAICGWAWRPAASDEPVTVELVAGDLVIASIVAKSLRGDLTDAGKRGGRCGFACVVTEKFPRGTPIHAQVVCEGRLHRIPGAPVVLGQDAPEPIPPEESPQEPLRATAPLPLSSPSGITGYIDEFGPKRIFGWAWWTHDIMRPVAIVLREAGRDIARIPVSAWRSDLYQRRQGDARCGINVPVPDVLRDGRTHLIDIVLAETNERLVPNPLEVCIPPGEPAPRARPMPARPPDSAPIQFSFIINFYNMRREAERTLTSLTRAYQRGVEDIPYEVLCIDNGSNPPLDRSWVESFGPEFKLVKPSRILPSPCAAINEAARHARGRYLAIMIDGAHLLTPGILREAFDAFAEQPDCIFAPRQWWLAGDQRWLSSVGYTREMEDVLFARIDWPSDGYELFRVGAPTIESPTSWLDGVGESNCLMMARTLFEHIGGMDEAFDEPGGGFANPDLFRRAAAATGDKIVSPVDEASFHQFHGGTTTNVSHEEEDRRVRMYENRYRELRGKAYSPVGLDRIQLRGRIRVPTDFRPHWRPWITAELGITEQIRPGNMAHHYHPKMQVYLQSVYAECGLHGGTIWAGRHVRLAPADLVNLQMILHSVRPEAIVTTSRDDGLLHFLETVPGAIGLESARIVRVTAEADGHAGGPHVHVVRGAPYSPATLSAVARAIGTAEQVVVLFEPQCDDFLPVDAIKTYARFVSLGSYFVFLGTVLGQPWLGYSRYWFAAAIDQFLQEERSFVRDPTKDEQIAVMCAKGYLKRARKHGDPFEAYDASLDEFSA